MKRQRAPPLLESLRIEKLSMHSTNERDTADVLDAETSRRLSTRLRQARQLRGMTLRTVANAVGCSESMLSKIENRKALPSLAMLTRLVRALDTSMGWLFDAPGDRGPMIYRPAEAPVRPVVHQATTLERIILDAASHDREPTSSTLREERRARASTGIRAKRSVTYSAAPLR